jgi:hypothetical protein
MTKNEANALNNAMPALQNILLGDKLMKALAVTGGFIYYLDPLNGVDSNDGMSPETAVKSLAIGYGKLRSGFNDTLIYLSNTSTPINLSAAFTWSKNNAHLIGVSALQPYGRARIGHNADFTSLFTITGTGNQFKGIHWQMGRGSATNINCVVLGATASYNYFENCHFDAPLNAVEGAGAYRALLITALCRSTTFKDCWFGDWTAAPSYATGALVEFGGTNAGTQFQDCTFIVNTTQTTHVPIIAAVDMGGGNAPGYVKFKNCDFLCYGTAAPAVIFTAPTVGVIYVVNCHSLGAGAWSGTSAHVLVSNGAADSSTGVGGLGHSVS